MRLTNFSDLSIRVLLLAASAPGDLTTIDQTATRLNVSRAHLMKVVNLLTRCGFLKAFRGRSGGFMLGAKPEDVNLGEVIAATEHDFGLVECMRPDNACALTKICKLPGVLDAAVKAFHDELSRYTLADIAVSSSDLNVIGLGR